MIDDILPLLCAGGLILAILVAVLFLIFGSRPFTYNKRKEGSNTCLTITAKKNLAKVTVLAKFGKESITFERKRIRKGQNIDFVFPASKRKIKLVVEAEKGKEKTFTI